MLPNTPEALAPFIEKAKENVKSGKSWAEIAKERPLTGSPKLGRVDIPTSGDTTK